MTDVDPADFDDSVAYEDGMNAAGVEIPEEMLNFIGEQEEAGEGLHLALTKKLSNQPFSPAGRKFSIEQPLERHFSCNDRSNEFFL